MTRQDDNDIGRFKLIWECLNNNAATITESGVTILNTYKTNLKTKTDLLTELSEEAAVQSQGFTLLKLEKRTSVVKAGSIIGGAIYSYSVDTNDTPLAVEMKKMTVPRLKKQKDEEVIISLMTIWSTATDLIPASPAPNPLEGYGITADLVEAFKALIEEYEDITTKPREIISGRKGVNDTLDVEFDNTEALIVKVNKVMEGMQDSYPTFYRDYKNASKRLKTMSLRTQIIGTVSIFVNPELGTTQAVQGAEVTIIAKEYILEKDGQTIAVETKPITVRTDSDGKYAVPRSDIHTTYTVICKLPGYGEQQKAHIGIKRGKKTSVNFLLEPIQSGS